MKKYKCPECGKISRTMYCDSCSEPIPPENEIAEESNLEGNHIAGTINEHFEELEKSLNDIKALLTQTEKNTSVVIVLSAITSICAVIATLIEVF